MIKLARAAWAAPKSRPKVWDRVVEKDRKMLALTQAVHDKGQLFFLEVIVLPRLRHFRAFVRATSGVEMYGPGRGKQGSIGSLWMTRYKQDYFVKHIQAHYRAGTAPNFLPRRLATRYGGWRIRALRIAFREAKLRNAAVIIPEHTLKKEKANKQRSAALLRDLHMVARELGAKVEEQPLGSAHGGLRISFD